VPLFKKFNRTELHIPSIEKRDHDLDLSVMLPLEVAPVADEGLFTVAKRIQQAKKNGSPIVLMIGAHVIRAGVQLYLIDLMERGYLSCVAMNGACAIHDYEFSLIGQTTESVSKYINEGHFGLWKETGQINEIVNQAARQKMGLGEAIGKAICEQDFPHKELSIFATGYRLKVLQTVHVSIGFDVTHEHPNCDGAAYGATSYTDFLRFAHLLESLAGGVVMNFGSAVMGPEVFLKALSMARNAARQKGKVIADFDTLVCDLKPLPASTDSEADKTSPDYYFRPWKTLLVRTLGYGGKSHYIQGGHRETIPALWTAINET
jgi:hypothetical protein